MPDKVWVLQVKEAETREAGEEGKTLWVPGAWFTWQNWVEKWRWSEGQLWPPQGAFAHLSSHDESCENTLTQDQGSFTSPGKTYLVLKSQRGEGGSRGRNEKCARKEML